MQDTMTILHLVRQGRRWLDAVKRTSNWELQSLAEGKAAEAEQAALLALSYPNHHQAASQLLHVQHHAEACVGAEAIALEAVHNTGGGEHGGGGVHPADAISLAAGGVEAAPAGDGGRLQTGGHPVMRARSTCCPSLEEKSGNKWRQPSGPWTSGARNCGGKNFWRSKTHQATTGGESTHQGTTQEGQPPGGRVEVAGKGDEGAEKKNDERCYHRKKKYYTIVKMARTPRRRSVTWGEGRRRRGRGTAHCRMQRGQRG